MTLPFTMQQPQTAFGLALVRGIRLLRLRRLMQSLAKSPAAGASAACRVADGH